MMKESEEREQYLREHEAREDRAHHPQDPISASSADSVARHTGPNPCVFLQIEIRGKLNGKVHASGRLEFELFADCAPKTSENFRCLVTGEKGRDLSFVNCMFHSITRGLMAQGGDITAGDGSGGRSIYGETFADENFSQRHDARGVLSMGNSGPNTNNSQFQLMFARATHLDKKHVVFGRMTRDEEGMLKHVEEAGSRSGLPQSMVSIVECGEIGGKSISASRRSRSRSRRLPKRVQLMNSGLISYNSRTPSSEGRKYSSMSDIGGRR
jgi:cyclophilin family peptidyl-prolyl cis-trans isomerase